jgi:hypothetical protein
MYATTLPLPTQTSHAGPAQAAVTADVTRPVTAAETLRPATAPGKADAVRGYTSEAALADPTRAEPGSVVNAKSTGQASGTETGKPADAEAPDPMVPPVPLRYLNQLMKPAEATPSASHGTVLAHDAVVHAEAAEKTAEAKSSLDILR